MIIESNFLKKYGRFEIFYMLVMVIYMAQATPETGRMIGGLSGNPIPFLLPIILTYMLWRKYPISFNNRKFYFVLIIYGIWAICSLIKYGIYTTEELSYHFFMVYAIVIAYIHNKIYGYTLVPIYEQILVFFCKIAIVGWLIAVLIPASSSFFHLFPETAFGNHVLYLFNWMDPAKGQIYSGIIRNAGCSWEPGRFAIMVTLAIFCNLCQNGIKFRNNKNIWWLLIALITTQSTTGYITALVLYTIFMVKKFNFKYISLFILVMIPIIYGLMQLDFMAEKITSRFFNAQNVSRLEEQFAWHEAQQEDGVYLGSIDRLDAMVFEWMNIMHDPILGYSRNLNHSYFSTHITSNFVLANGLIKIVGMFGLILGTFFFCVLFYSSIRIARNSKVKRKLGLFILICVSAISYPILSIPVFTSFWFYGFFGENKIKQ
ncbi:MAG TPA: hypothetical protein H9924_01430 [Candidatus Phocaeicola merdavium]|nr:hypothetical protein [Candidatus Phocaeicola merdavium]